MDIFCPTHGFARRPGMSTIPRKPVSSQVMGWVVNVFFPASIWLRFQPYAAGTKAEEMVSDFVTFAKLG